MCVVVVAVVVVVVAAAAAAAAAAAVVNAGFKKSTLSLNSESDFDSRLNDSFRMT